MIRQKKIGDRLLRGTPYQVVVRDTDIVLQINGRDALVLPYDEAIRMCIGLRHGVRIAKKNAGISGVQMYGFADLTDAVADELEMQKSRDGTAVYFQAR